MHQCFGHARPYPCLCISILIMQGLIFTYTPQPCKGLILAYASTLLSLNLAYVPLPCKASSLFMHQYFRHSRPHLCLCIRHGRPHYSSIDEPSTMVEVLDMDVPIPCKDVHFKRRGEMYINRGPMSDTF